MVVPDEHDVAGALAVHSHPVSNGDPARPTGPDFNVEISCAVGAGCVIAGIPGGGRRGSYDLWGRGPMIMYKRQLDRRVVSGTKGLLLHWLLMRPAHR